MAKVYILCGKVASGKTTYANQIKNISKSVILSHDELMLKLFDGCLGPKHDDTVNRISNYFYTMAKELISLDINVIFDFGYWTKSERTKTRDYFQAEDICVEIHYLKTDDVKRLKWLKKRNDSLINATSRVYIINDELRQRLDSKFEEPTNDEVDKIIEI